MIGRKYKHKGGLPVTLMQIFPALRELHFWSMALRFLTACVCGGVIGYTRGLHQRPAGFRTHVLVCLGGAATVIMSQFSIEILGVPGDTMRVPAQVISGIGFLGAGCIIHMGSNRTHTTGVTTAAGLWATGAMGLLSGAGYLECAILMCVIIYLVQGPMYHLDSSFVKLKLTLMAYVELDSSFRLSEIITALQEHQLQLSAIEPFGTKDADHVGYKIEVWLEDRSLTPDQALDFIRTIDQVQFAQRLDEIRS